MKKLIFLALLSLAATLGLASEKLTLKLAPGGPEHGTLRAYHLIGDKICQHYNARDTIGDTIFNRETTTEKIHYLGIIFVVGEGFDHDRIIMASKGITNREMGQPIEEETGFSHWGFVKKYQMKTLITTYSRLSKSPLIVSVANNFVYSQKENFHFGTIVALLFLLLLGEEIGQLIIDPKRWWRYNLSIIKDLGSELFGLILLFAIEAYCLIWSYHVGTPFIYLAAALILIGLLLGFRGKIFPKKKNLAVKASPQ